MRDKGDDKGVGIADLHSPYCSARGKQSCWDQRGEPNGVGEQREEGLVSLPTICLIQENPVAAKGSTSICCSWLVPFRKVKW